MLRIGVDVGGTNTDAAILRDQTLIASTKRPTTADVSSGVVDAIRSVIDGVADPSEIDLVVLGTTHFVNALVQRKTLERVAVFRLAAPSCTEIPIQLGWPADLKECVPVLPFIVGGGYQFDGSEIAPLDEAAIRQGCREAKAAGVTQAVVVGVFSPMKRDQELRARAIIAEELGAEITMSSELGGIGLLERENSAILNAALRPLAKSTILGLQGALNGMGFDKTPIFFTRNDSSLMTGAEAIEYPVHMFSSGTTNSMRGAAFISKVTDAIVVDIGGTTTDVGRIAGGFAVESNHNVEICGVQTNFSMPQVVSLGLGGGSHVKVGDDTVSVGPQSVGYELPQKALVFGGSVLTATDAAVAAGHIELGDKSKATVQLDESTTQRVIAKMIDMIESAVLQAKVAQDDIEVLVIGGGAILLPKDLKLRGASKVTVVEHSGVANAVGAAISRVSGLVDAIIGLQDGETPEERIEAAKKRARDLAVQNGALPDTIHLIEVTEVPLAYIPGQFARIRVKALGEVDLSRARDLAVVAGAEEVTSFVSNLESDAPVVRIPPAKMPDIGSPSQRGDEWVLTEDDIECIGIGAAVLGSGGGGSANIAVLLCKEVSRSGQPIRIIPPESIKDDEMILPVAYMGAPSVGLEKMQGCEIQRAAEFVRETLEKENVKIAALGCCEIGGMNSVMPLVVAAQSGLPVVDCDGMGRAFPELQMFVPFIYGQKPWLAAIAGAPGEPALFRGEDGTPKDLENMFRSKVVEMGCIGGVVFPPAKGEDLKTYYIPNTLSQAWSIGNAVLRARAEKSDPVAAIVASAGGAVLFRGVVTNIRRDLEGGFNLGRIIVDGAPGTEFESKEAVVDFQNENLIICVDGEMVAVVPDIITLVDAESAYPFQTEQIKFGLRVAIVGVPCHERLTTETALGVVGPAAFKFDCEYARLSGYRAPKWRGSL
eukprot:m.292602 g.292602  ORF g.292602 m.292602 type:complete len:938 (-) comp12645_c0_seq1:139-2952(-)